MLECDTIYGFFDGVKKARNCGTAMILHIDDSHNFKLQMGVGSGTDTFLNFKPYGGFYGSQKKEIFFSFVFLATQSL